MKVNSYEEKSFSENYYQRIADFGRDRPWVQLFGIVCLALAMIAITNVAGVFLIELNAPVVQFSLSVSALLLLLFAGLFLLFNGYRYAWGVSFLALSASFLGLSLGLPVTGVVSSGIWLLPVVLFSAGMWTGMSGLYSDNKVVNYLPAVLISVIGGSWVMYALVVLESLEMAVAGSTAIFVPVVLAVAYIWYRFGRNSDISSPWLLAFGFLLMGLISIIWNPLLVGTQLYYIFFSVFIVSLVLTIGGFLMVTRDLFN